MGLQNQTQGQATPGVPLHLSSNDEFAHLFARHDRHFQQIMHDRQSTLEAIDKQAKDIVNHLTVVKQKSNEIAEKMEDVSTVIEGERARWKK